MSVTLAPNFDGDRSKSEPGDVSRLGWIVLCLIFAVGAANQLLRPVIDDVSWLFVVDEKLLAGKRLYVDVIEVNPPMSAFLYMPAVLLQHLTGLAAETWQVAVTLSVVAASLMLSARTLKFAGNGNTVVPVTLAAAIVLVLLPAATFSQREHLALALLLPCLALYAARAEGRPVDRVLCAIAGLTAGLAMAIKPQFAAALLLPSMFVAYRRRSPRTLLALEHWLAVAVVLAYSAILVICFRPYLTDVLPMLSETYRKLRRPLNDLMFDLPFLLTVFGATGIVIGVGYRRLSTAAWVRLLAALGFALSYIEQGKGWPYHLFPAIGLVLIVFFVDALPQFVASLRRARAGVRNAIGSVAVLAAALMFLTAELPFLAIKDWSALPLVAKVRQLGAHPRVLAFSYQLSVGHPLTRMVGGDWVGTVGAQFLTGNAKRIAAASSDPAVIKRMDYWIAHDRDMATRDLRDGRPDALLIDHKTFDLDEYLASSSEAAALVAGYRRIATVNDIDLMVPRQTSDILAATVAMGARAP